MMKVILPFCRLARCLALALALALILTLTPAAAGALAAPAASAAPVFTASATLRKGGEPTTFHVYATEESLPGHEGEPIYRIEYQKTQGGVATQPLLFACVGGTEMIPMLRFIDLNLDGWLDIEALYVPGAANISCTYFINGGESETFYPAPVLDDLSWYQLYPKQRLIVNFQHDSVMTGVYTLYRWPEGAALPYAYRVASYVDDDRDGWQTVRDLVTEYDENGAETVLRDESWSRDISEADWLRQEAERNRALWQGLDATEPPLPQALYRNPQGGRYYHAKAECESISPRYYAVMEVIQRSQLNDAAYAALTPCPICCNEERSAQGR